MPNVFRGKAQVSGTDAVGNFDIIVYPVNETQRLTHEFEEDIVQDNTGSDMAWRSRNEKILGEIGVFFVADTVAHSKTGAAFFAPYAIMTVSNCAVAAWNTTWQLVSGSDIDQKNTDIARGHFRWRRYVDATQNTLAAAVPA
jgi:hypothetical protein